MGVVITKRILFGIKCPGNTPNNNDYNVPRVTVRFGFRGLLALRMSKMGKRAYDEGIATRTEQLRRCELVRDK